MINWRRQLTSFDILLKRGFTVPLLYQNFLPFFPEPEDRLRNICHCGNINGQPAAKAGLLVQSVQWKSKRSAFFVGVCAVKRPSPQLMSALLSEESLVYAFSKGRICKCERYKRESTAWRSALLFMLSLRITTSFFNLTLFGKHPLLVSSTTGAAPVSDFWFQTYEHIREKVNDETFEGLILSSLAPHLVSFTSFFYIYTRPTPGRTTTVISTELGWVHLVQIVSRFVLALHFMAYSTCVTISDLCFSVLGHCLHKWQRGKQRFKQV